jgi:hypothetical protein
MSSAPPLRSSYHFNVFRRLPYKLCVLGRRSQPEDLRKPEKKAIHKDMMVVRMCPDNIFQGNEMRAAACDESPYEHASDVNALII